MFLERKAPIFRFIRRLSRFIWSLCISTTKRQLWWLTNKPLSEDGKLFSLGLFGSQIFAPAHKLYPCRWKKVLSAKTSDRLLWRVLVPNCSMLIRDFNSSIFENNEMPSVYIYIYYIICVKINIIPVSVDHYYWVHGKAELWLSITCGLLCLSLFGNRGSTGWDAAIEILDPPILPCGRMRPVPLLWQQWHAQINHQELWFDSKNLCAAADLFRLLRSCCFVLTNLWKDGCSCIVRIRKDP